MGSFFIPMAVMVYVYVRISCVVAARHDHMTEIEVHKVIYLMEEKKPTHTPKYQISVLTYRNPYRILTLNIYVLCTYCLRIDKLFNAFPFEIKSSISNISLISCLLEFTQSYHSTETQ